VQRCARQRPLSISLLRIHGVTLLQVPSDARPPRKLHGSGDSLDEVAKECGHRESPATRVSGPCSTTILDWEVNVTTVS